MAFVYWIRRESHSDISTQGYVGFTTQTIAARFQQHRSYHERGLCSHYPIYRAFCKYDDLIITAVIEGSIDYCLMMEEALRPIEAVGWNIRKGGCSIAPSRITSEETRGKLSRSGKGRKLSQKTKDRQSAARKLQELNFTDEQILARRKRTTGLVRSDETRLKQSIAKQKYSGMPWKNPNSNKEIWSVCLQAYKILTEFPNAKQSFISNSLGIESNIIVLFKKLKAGWNPSEDEAYLKWLVEYKEINNE